MKFFFFHLNSDAARFNVEDARTSYDSVVNNAEDVGTPIRISKSDQGTRQTCDDIHILSKGKTVQGADTDDGTPLDREKSVHVLTPDMLTETPKRDEYPKSKRQNITGTVSSNDLHVRHHLLGPGLTTQEGRKNVERGNPTMVYFPSHPTAEEWANITAASKSGIALTGSAAMGKVGPVIGLMDVGECEDAYLFRLALPGVKRDESKLYIMTLSLARSIVTLSCFYIPCYSKIIFAMF